VFLLDDGLASGFTMLAAIKMVENYNPQKIYVAVPTAPHRTVNKVEMRTNATVYSPDIKKVMRFAVANAYENWYDVPESEVKDILTHSRYYRSRIE
jgi:predicted phosphoribosyltransferase